MYRILATFIFFTRLPFWQIANVPKEYFERVVPLWPMVGWLTGSVMALVAWTTSSIPINVSVILCLMVRILMTGALHEDGFADFCDGFGGGNSRQRTLEIMKDSHIGTYGVLGLIVYFLLQVYVLSSAETALSCYIDFATLLIVGDTFSKWTSSTIVYFLPYARKEKEAKNHLIFQQVPTGERLISLALGVLPMCIFIPFTSGLTLMPLLFSASASMLTAVGLFHFMNRKIQGYTGDCCGATFIITEAVFYLVFIAIY